MVELVSIESFQTFQSCSYLILKTFSQLFPVIQMTALTLEVLTIRCVWLVSGLVSTKGGGGEEKVMELWRGCECKA